MDISWKPLLKMDDLGVQVPLFLETAIFYCLTQRRNKIQASTCEGVTVFSLDAFKVQMGNGWLLGWLFQSMNI